MEYGGTRQTIPLDLGASERRELVMLASEAASPPNESGPWFGLDGRPAEILAFP